MKLLVLSDLHLEFAAFEPDFESAELADVAVLAGDIHKSIAGITVRSLLGILQIFTALSRSIRHPNVVLNLKLPKLYAPFIDH